jgi:hypothetical protein
MLLLIGYHLDLQKYCVFLQLYALHIIAHGEAI